MAPTLINDISTTEFYYLLYIPHCRSPYACTSFQLPETLLGTSGYKIFLEGITDFDSLARYLAPVLTAWWRFGWASVRINRAGLSYPISTWVE